MASSTGRPPLRISKVAGRYLLFDIDDIMYLRRHHNICSVFVGTIPQSPQQNIFMGLPIELMPEEAQVLVDKKVGYVVDDAMFHLAQLGALDEQARRGYVQSIKTEGRKAQMEAVEYQQRFKPKKIPAKEKPAPKSPEASSESTLEKQSVEEDTSLFDSPSTPLPSDQPSSTPNKPEPAAEPLPFAITPTTSSLLLTPPPSEPDDVPAVAPVDVPASYALYAHLQDKGYFMMPGLRFGCDYNVYPGDPLRFHSHFQATSYGWDEEISMLDLTAGGRLGTTVKKGYLIGGAVGEDSADQTGEGTIGQAGETAAQDDGETKAYPPPVRAFCIEWAAM